MAGLTSNAEKKTWAGRVVAVQPRIRLLRSFDERSRSYLGYMLRIDGTYSGEVGEFLIAVGEAAHKKHRFQSRSQTRARRRRRSTRRVGSRS